MNWLSRRIWSSRKVWTVVGLFGSVMLGALTGAVVSALDNWWIWGWIGIALAVSGLAAVRLTRIGQTAGTVYFVWSQFSGSASWHEEALEGLRKDRSDLRVLTRPIASAPQDGVLDLTEHMVETARALEAVENTDGTDSGYHFAPDLLWPLGLALGSMMYGAWPNQTLNELPTDQSGAANAQPTQPAFTWSLRATEKTLKIKKELAKCTQPDFEMFSSKAGGSGDYAFVTVQLTGNLKNPDGSPTLRPQELTGIDWYAVASFENDPPSWESRLKPVSVLGDGKNRSHSPGQVHAYLATAMAVTAIREALCSEKRLVLLAMQVPKTVAVGIGWHLMHDRLVSGPNAERVIRADAVKNPWRRLILLNYNHSKKGYDAVRVRPDQPDIDTHQRVMRGLGLA